MDKIDPVCPDCRCALRPIRILDATEPGLGRSVQKGSMHISLSYAAPDAKPGWFSGAIPREGIVRGFIRPECGRILLYGEAKP